jgi:para-aminobenzoate synthetase / 4-amino-4-deoxychorismate lyase
MLDAIDHRKPFILLEDSHGGDSWLFSDLASVVTAKDAPSLQAAFPALRRALGANLYAAGWIGFEAGYGLEPKLIGHIEPGQELLWFGLFKSRRRLSALEVETMWRTAVATPQQAAITTLTPRWSVANYAKQMAKVHDYILAGDIYQANLTFPADVRFEGSPLALYRHYRAAQRVPYGALIFTGQRWILSFSPELFFDLRQQQITAQPMKGTAPRHCLPELDQLAAEILQQDDKNRAENLMIVDLLRNDLSRVSVPGSVQVPELYGIISYPTIHQMVSTVRAKIAEATDAVDVLRALFPCGSITGAPKLRAMEIIKQVESGPRDIYCGAIGQLTPDGDASFNVAIRTLAITAPGTAVLGLGSGIVADSVAEDEYRECLLKAKFLQQNAPPFDLIETMAWQPDTGWQAWQAHMLRLQNSAKYWHFPFNTLRLATEATALARDWTCPMKVRLLLSRFGESCWQAQPLKKPPQSAFVVMSHNPMRSDNIFLYHKTSHRAFYDDERHRLQAKTGCIDCLFLNERGELTEGSFTNIFMRTHHKLLTPALSSGLLPGILRQSLIESGEAREAVLTLEDLTHADELYIGNSVRGLIQVEYREL